MTAQASVLQGAKIVGRAPARFGWALLRLATPLSFVCAQCHRRTVDTAVAVETGGTVDGQVFCSGCHERRSVEGPSLSEPRLAEAPTSSAAAAEQAAAEQAGAEGVHERAPGPDEPLVIQQPDPGVPHDVTETDAGITWTFVLRERHLHQGLCPVPPQAVGHLRRATVVRLHDGRAFPTVLLDSRYKKVPRDDIRGVRWPRTQIMLGARISAELSQGHLDLRLTPLERPVLIARKRFLYAYDAQVVVRELPADPPRGKAGANPLDSMVLDTIRKLGYLDEKGRALLPMANLVDNVHRAYGHGPSRSGDAVRAAVNRLLSSKRLTWQTGSRTTDGRLNFPARKGEKAVRLVCYQPFDLPRLQDAQRRVIHLPGASSLHTVSGHLMRIDHLGKQASEAAQGAYAEAHRQAGLAGSRRLPKGHTYVKPHRRGGK
ncbi:hypothetical protein [Streptomyces sp. SP2-10]|uniref:hypothetical protein n=1 Tax=Streptomyces sp. SP2-10 TaxID=2873385 RepID=UPI001CA7A516|nr:hypothetical protein [Streptomyces sp. SP2-10]MBY8845834.1 hypothetical protein [Streptomyces sp. SP2-10]